MSPRLRPGACVSLVVLALGCGPSPEPSAPTAPAADPWPTVAPLPPDAVDVRSALGSPDGAELRVRARLVAVTLPCPVCRVGERTGVSAEGKIGKSARPKAPAMPGCLPCPTPAATVSDDAAGPSAARGVPLRAVGVAEGLQRRHVGKVFLLTGTFHAAGATGPELDVTDVRALDER